MRPGPSGSTGWASGWRGASCRHALAARPAAGHGSAGAGPEPPGAAALPAPPWRHPAGSAGPGSAQPGCAGAGAASRAAQITRHGCPAAAGRSASSCPRSRCRWHPCNSCSPAGESGAAQRCPGMRQGPCPLCSQLSSSLAAVTTQVLRKGAGAAWGAWDGPLCPEAIPGHPGS